MLFRSFPGSPENRVNAFTPGSNDDSYLRADAVSWALLSHEALHKFPGLDDEAIMLAWKKSGLPDTRDIDTKGASAQITTLINKKCK